MNLRSALILLVILGLLAGCVPATSIPTMETTTATTSIVTTHIAIPTRPETAIPMSPFPSSTPLSGTPTVTPTFDPSTIVTVTPAQAAVCPKEDPSIKVDFLIPQKFEDILDPNLITDEKVLSYLNQGGTISQLLTNLRTGYMKKTTLYQDFTNDGVNDLLIRFFYGYGYSGYSIFSCMGGVYMSYAVPTATPDIEWAPLTSGAHIITVKDMNKNGMPEIVLTDDGSYLITEWNGSNFSIISYDKKNNQIPFIHSESRPPEIKDVNHDGLDELILTGADIYYYGLNESYYEGMPWRDEIRVYVWNGDFYSQLPSEYSTPEYRFQAVQDGDRYALQNKYARALSLYQDAIFSDKLKEWSPEMHAYYVGIPKSYMNKQPTPTFPAPNLDPTEYPRLAAYAYFRIVLLHILQGHESDAGTVYQTLQQKFPEGDPGFSYAEMATAFWNEYQSSHDMTAACKMAVEYATEHPEILTPLGSDYHGMQSHTYKPEDICPFR